MGCWCSAHPGGPRKPYCRLQGAVAVTASQVLQDPRPRPAPNPAYWHPKQPAERVNGVIERQEWSRPQASCSVTELLRHDQRHTFSAWPRDFPLCEHLSNPTLFQQQRSVCQTFPRISPPSYPKEKSHATEHHNSHQMSAVHPEADINQPIASA